MSSISPAVVTPARRSRPVLPAAAALAVVVASVAAFVVWRPLGHGLVDYPDLEVYLRAGQRLVDGKALYGDDGPLLPFTYPPFAAVVSAPLAALPRLLAAWGWLVVNVVLLAVAVGLCGRAALARLPGHLVLPVVGLATAVLVWARPVNGTLDWGQVNLVLLVLVLTDTLVLERGRGALVGVAGAIKLVPGIFIGYFLVTRQWRAAATAGLTAVVCTAAAALLAPASSRQYWTTTLFDAGRIGDRAYTSNQSLLGIAARTVPEGWVTPVWLVAAAGIALLGLRRVRQAHAGGAVLAAVTLTGLVGALCSPVTWIHHLVWIVPVAGVLIGDGRDRRRLAAAGAVVLVSTVSLPFLGLDLADKGLVTPLAWLLQNSMGLGAAALVLWLPISPSASSSAPGRCRAEAACRPGS